MHRPVAHELEVYAFTEDAAAVALALARELGPWQTVPAPLDEPGRYEAGGAVPLLQRSQDGSLSVWLRGSDHWPTSAALGRYLAHSLGCELRCEPEPAHGVDRHSNVFLRITPAGEGFITWE